MEIITVVYREALHQEGGEARPGASSKRMEHQEPLEAGAGVDKLPDPVEHQVDDLLADRVVAPGGVLHSSHDVSFCLTWRSCSPRPPCR